MPASYTNAELKSAVMLVQSEFPDRIADFEASYVAMRSLGYDHTESTEAVRAAFRLTNTKADDGLAVYIICRSTAGAAHKNALSMINDDTVGIWMELINSCQL